MKEPIAKKSCNMALSNCMAFLREAVKELAQSSEIPELGKETASLTEMGKVGVGGGRGVPRRVIKAFPCVTVTKSSNALAVSSAFIVDRTDQRGWITLHLWTYYH